MLDALTQIVREHSCTVILPLIAVGVTADDQREILGLDVVPGEDGAGGAVLAAQHRQMIVQSTMGCEASGVARMTCGPPVSTVRGMSPAMRRESPATCRHVR
jgi:Transposase, Mutator family